AKPAPMSGPMRPTSTRTASAPQSQRVASFPPDCCSDPCRFRSAQPHESVQPRRKRPMSDDITFDKSFDLEPGRAEEVLPGVRRIVADNPGPFTFKGTLTYILGRGKVAIVDPGPDDPDHVQAVLDAVRGETVTHIFVTHTHRDH